MKLFDKIKIGSKRISAIGIIGIVVGCILLCVVKMKPKDSPTEEKIKETLLSPVDDALKNGEIAVEQYWEIATYVDKAVRNYPKISMTEIRKNVDSALIIAESCKSGQIQFKVLPDEDNKISFCVFQVSTMAIIVDWGDGLKAVLGGRHGVTQKVVHVYPNQGLKTISIYIGSVTDLVLPEIDFVVYPNIQELRFDERIGAKLRTEIVEGQQLQILRLSISNPLCWNSTQEAHYNNKLYPKNRVAEN